MKKIDVNVYELSELSEKSKNKSINNYLDLFPFNGLVDSEDYYKSILHDYYLDTDLLDQIIYDLDKNYINIKPSDKSNRLLKSSLLILFKFDGVTNDKTLNQFILGEIKKKYSNITIAFLDMLDVNFCNTRYLDFDINYNYNDMIEYFEKNNIEYDLLSYIIADLINVFIKHIGECLEKIRISLNNGYEYHCSFENINEISLFNNWYYTIDGNFYNGDI